ncbi:MAG: PEP-CTERM sorting domain-containing protein [Phycisphaerales bacterium]|nr:MAG: PEP-CTERM sorting domain-containing protein [Phycisphaerales bacterium]
MPDKESYGTAMRRCATLRLSLLAFAVAVEPVPADVILELRGPSELSVEPAIPYTPGTPFPAEGESAVVWGTMTNTGNEVFEALGPIGRSVRYQGAALVLEAPFTFWDPGTYPGEPFILTSSGYVGVSLAPGESLSLPVIEVWGVEILDESPPFAPAQIGSVMTICDIELSMLSGFESDPFTQDPDTFLVLDTVLTVTVIPEPATLVLFTLAVLGMLRRRRVGQKSRAACRQSP